MPDLPVAKRDQDPDDVRANENKQAVGNKNDKSVPKIGAVPSAISRLKSVPKIATEVVGSVPKSSGSKSEKVVPKVAAPSNEVSSQLAVRNSNYKMVPIAGLKSRGCVEEKVAWKAITAPSFIFPIENSQSTCLS